MAQPTNTFDTYDAVGEREDLMDIIYDISPIETPFQSNVARTTAKGTFHEWQTDALAAAAANAQVQGDDIASNSLVATTRLGQHTQISRKAVTISGTLDAVDKAGRAKETSYQLAKAGRELKRDMELELTQVGVDSAGTGTTAPTFAGVESWISTNYSDNGVGTTPGVAAGGTVLTAPTDGTQVTLTEALLKAGIKNAWSAGGDPRVIMVGGGAKQKISGFSGIATVFKNAPAGQATIVGAADLYVSDFGEHQIVPNRFSRDRTVLILDLEMWAVAFLRPIMQLELAKTGDAEKRALLGEYTLVSRNEAASAKVADISSAL